MQKVMVTVFWDASGVLLVDFLPHGQNITVARYIVTLKKLKRAIRRKRPGLVDDQILLLHDNARPHSALRTVEAIQKFGWSVLPHPPYSPDLAPSDYHLFGKMKESLRGNQYGSIDDVGYALRAWIKQTPTHSSNRALPTSCHGGKNALLPMVTTLRSSVIRICHNSQYAVIFYWINKGYGILWCRKLHIA